MAQAITSSIANSGCAKKRIACFDRNKEKKDLILINGFELKELEALVKESDFIFICVKPKDFDSLLNNIAKFINKQILVSIVAGKDSEKMISIIGNKKVVRVMPNIAAIVSESVNAFSAKNLSENEEKEIKLLLSSFGEAIEIEENFFNSVTAISGCGPAFMAYFIETFSAVAQENGLEKKLADSLVIQTIVGTISLLKNDFSESKIIESVSSPGGATIEGRKILEAGEFEKIIKQTINASKKKSEELNKK